MVHINVDYNKTNVIIFKNNNALQKEKESAFGTILTIPLLLVILIKSYHIRLKNALQSGKNRVCVFLYCKFFTIISYVYNVSVYEYCVLFRVLLAIGMQSQGQGAGMVDTVSRLLICKQPPYMAYTFEPIDTAIMYPF